MEDSALVEGESVPVAHGWWPTTRFMEINMHNIKLHEVISHFDKHTRASYSVFTHGYTRAAFDHLHQNTIETLPWPKTRNLNPIGHIMDLLGRRIKKRDSPVQNVK